MSLLWNRHTRSLMLRLVQHLPLHKGRVMCVCWGGKQYGCNPKAITDAIMADAEARSQFEVWYAFFEPQKFQSQLPKGVRAVEIGSLQYFRLLATSQFIIANTRFGGGIYWSFPKRKGQIYIQTMHGPQGVKKVEFAAVDTLPKAYIESAMEDNRRTDLMLSNSDYSTERCHSAFLYEGEILDKGLPRNDEFMLKLEQESRPDYPFSLASKHYLVYAPTFRANGRRDVYQFNIDKVIAALETKFGGEWYIRISSHPNMRSYYHEIYDFSHPRLIDIGGDDLQQHLLTSDALMTDYSSSELDFSLRQLPVFQYCKDRHDYDRGFYLEPSSLPFPYAETEEQLIANILHFDNEKYLTDLARFNSEVIGLHESGHASEAVVKWMQKHL
ncbi:MAG: CDP-glycerol glycerophosphotransferase family protein [Bacteroidales bacterium]|nr:CDP-glycerol glycerophosphotransferase family protein [Bacteroidales bacterium]